ncbi:hypothetical protein BDAP_002019 [Binucleata daphniae]
MIILVDDKIHKISILEIEDLQIIDTNNTSNEKTGKKINDGINYNKYEESKNNNKIETKNNKKVCDEKKDTKQAADDKIAKRIEAKNAEKSAEKNAKEANNYENKVELRNKTMIYNESCVKKMSNLVEKLSLNDIKKNNDLKYKAFFSDAFLFYGPTEDAFVTIVGELLVDFFSDLSKSSFCIILNENSVLTRIGFYLAKRFIDKNIKVSVLRKTIDSANVCIEKNIYTNLNGKIDKFTDELFDYIIVDSNDKNKYYEHLYRNAAFCLNCENKNYRKAVGFYYGIVKDDCNDFDGKLFLIDCGFNDVLYKKYDFINYCDGKITRYK